jgi:hypothetical protein
MKQIEFDQFLIELKQALEITNQSINNFHSEYSNIYKIETIENCELNKKSCISYSNKSFEFYDKSIRFDCFDIYRSRIDFTMVNGDFTKKPIKITMTFNIQNVKKAYDFIEKNSQ